LSGRYLWFSLVKERREIKSDEFLGGLYVFRIHVGLREVVIGRLDIERNWK